MIFYFVCRQIYSAFLALAVLWFVKKSTSPFEGIEPALTELILSLFPIKVLGSKGEERFPDLSHDEGKQKQFSEIFDENNKDRLHYCENCEDDWRGLTSGRNYVEVREYYNEKLDLLIIFK